MIIDIILILIMLGISWLIIRKGDLLKNVGGNTTGNLLILLGVVIIIICIIFLISLF